MPRAPFPENRSRVGRRLPHGPPPYRLGFPPRTEGAACPVSLERLSWHRAPALAIPARANVLPSAEHIQAATDLSPREADVARHLAEGKTDRAIAEHFGISPYTVRRHTGSILTKLDLSSRGGVALALLWACAARQSNRPIPTAATVSHRTGPLPTPTAPFK